MSHSDSEDDFVEVSGYQSSDSDWEKISVGYKSSEEGEEELVGEPAPPTGTNNNNELGYPHELVTSYYQNPNHTTTHTTVTKNIGPASILDDLALSPLPTTNTINEKREKPRVRATGSKPESRRGKAKERKKHWDKVTLKRGNGAPYDPVEFLGITGGEKALLSHFSITTIGQLAYFNAMEFVSSTHPDKFAIILDLQERAYQAVTEYVTKVSTQPDTVWGYLYLGDKALKQILKNGYLDSDSLFFLWSPMPAVQYRDQLAIDDLVGMETKNRDLRNRYSRFVKINLTKLCNNYYGRLYQRDLATGNSKWINISLLEAAELAQREDMWYSFEPGNDIFSHVCHGSIVMPTGKISQDCMEMDKESCVFTRRNERNEENESDDEREESNPTVAAKLDFYY